MRRRLALLLALAVPAARCSAPPSASLGLPGAAALAADDACGPGLRPGAAGGAACALGVLQVGQRRDPPSGKPAPEGQASADEFPSGWFVPLSDIFDSYGFKNTTRGRLSAWMGAEIDAQTPQCPTWTAYYWPQLTFWTREIVRRYQQITPGDEEQLKKAQEFARHAAYLVGIAKMDPRSGHAWSEPTQGFFRLIAASDEIKLPPLPEFFRLSSNYYDMSATLPMVLWFLGLVCDLDWWRRELLGSRPDGPEICWDKVPHPGFGFTWMGKSLQVNVRSKPADRDPVVWPEYEACQEPLNTTVLAGICPWGGRLRPGDGGVTFWGSGVPASARKEVQECRAGLPPFPEGVGFSLIYFDEPLLGLGTVVYDGPPPMPNDTYHLGMVDVLNIMATYKIPQKMLRDAAWLSAHGMLEGGLPRYPEAGSSPSS